MGKNVLTNNEEFSMKDGEMKSLKRLSRLPSVKLHWQSRERDHKTTHTKRKQLIKPYWRHGSTSFVRLRVSKTNRIDSLHDLEWPWRIIYKLFRLNGGVIVSWQPRYTRSYTDSLPNSANLVFVTRERDHEAITSSTKVKNQTLPATRPPVH